MPLKIAESHIAIHKRSIHVCSNHILLLFLIALAILMNLN